MDRLVGLDAEDRRAGIDRLSASTRICRKPAKYRAGEGIRTLDVNLAR
jgi:hypothetical protein